ncbi:MAG TPA: YbaB/EbfC family nucleoid-associated protein [Thermodesulfobacteriota bacterium]|nr:YbaB/EbfC family nucleoid-associated protein [Thermodesulfobacteriota bacterium]
MDRNLGHLLRQAQKVQQKIQELQQELASRTVEASAGGGMVVAVVNGKQELVSLRIEKEVIDPDDPGMLQDLVIAAVNEAMKKMQQVVAEEMGKLTGGFGLPGLSGPGGLLG